jgi:hypothetical protein
MLPSEPYVIVSHHTARRWKTSHTLAQYGMRAASPVEAKPGAPDRGPPGLLRDTEPPEYRGWRLSERRGRSIRHLDFIEVFLFASFRAAAKPSPPEWYRSRSRP